MAEAARRDNEVLAIADYLEETIEEIDGTIATLEARRSALAIRLAVIRAADDSKLTEAGEDYLARVADGRPYEDAQDADKVLGSAYMKYGTPSS